jgi:ribonucleoside-diphosphate reductase subunit M2
MTQCCVMPPCRDAVPVQLKMTELVEHAAVPTPSPLPTPANATVQSFSSSTGTVTQSSTHTNINQTYLSTTSSTSSTPSTTTIHIPTLSKSTSHASGSASASASSLAEMDSDVETEVGVHTAPNNDTSDIARTGTPDNDTTPASISFADISLAETGWRGDLPTSTSASSSSSADAAIDAVRLGGANAGASERTADAFVEPILSPTQDRFVLFPIQHNDLWEMYQKHFSCLWRTEEIDLSNDLKHWTAMTDNERYFISMILAFFAASDGIVIENLAARFTSEIQLPEARAFYAIQTLMETVHSHTYSVLIDKYASGAQEKDKLFHAVTQFPCIQKKAEWALKWISDKQSQFAKRLVAFACVEGIFFSGAFCSIFWLKKRGLMPGLTFSNELISRDEALHCEFAILLYSKLVHPLTMSELHEIVKEAVEIEIEFICEALPCNLIGMNAKLMSQYIQYVADRLCMQFGHPAIYGTSNPFDFMELISLDGKTNFFERKVGEYALSNKGNFDDDLEFEADF